MGIFGCAGKFFIFETGDSATGDSATLGGSSGGDGSLSVSSISIMVTPLSVEFSRGRVKLRDCDCARWREELRRGAGFGWEENRGYDPAGAAGRGADC